MIPIYEESTDHIQINERKAGHFPPHLHKSVEMVLVTHGSLAIGTGVDLWEMKEGDFAVVFPNLIHHYQVFNGGDNRNITLLASPSYFSSYEDFLQTWQPADPVIPKDQLHPDINYALKRLMELNPEPSRKGRHTQHHRKHKAGVWMNPTSAVLPASSGNVSTDGSVGIKSTASAATGSVRTDTVNDASSISNIVASRSTNALNHAYIQILLARAVPAMKLIRRGDIRDQDIVYQVVAYVSAHYAEDMTQEQMAAALGLTPSALSRVFSQIFHQNFNHYLNEVRLEHVAVLLTQTTDPVTDICYDCGFQSQATFNRVFQEKYRMTPREYRKAQNA